MDGHGQPSVDPSAVTGTVQPSIAFFRSVVQRSRDRSRRRYLPACSISPHQGTDVWKAGHHLAEPSDDEDLTVDLPGNPLALPSFLSLPLASLDRRPTMQVDATAAKRPGDPFGGGVQQGGVRGSRYGRD